MQVVELHNLAELYTLIRHEPDGRRRDRLRAVALAAQGHTAEEVAALLHVGRRSVQRWVGRYNAWGPEGLRHRLGAGAPSKLPPRHYEAFKARLEAGPTAADGVCVFHGEDVRRILEREFGVLYSLDGVYKLLHRLGYSWLVPRPRHPKADAEAQERFKKTSRSSSRPSKRRCTRSTLVSPASG